MEKHLVAAVVLATSVFSSDALAADFAPASPPADPNFYIELDGGINFYPDTTWEYPDQDQEQEFDDGYLIKGAIGAHLPHNFRVEIEGAYRNNNADSTVTTNGGPFELGGDVKVWSVMANGFYDMEVGQFDIFVGAGLGYASVDFDTDFSGFNFVQADGSDDRFAYQLMAGTAWNFTEAMALTLEYTYFDTVGDKANVFNTGLGNVTIDAPYRSHAVSAGLRFNF